MRVKLKSREEEAYKRQETLFRLSVKDKMVHFLWKVSLIFLSCLCGHLHGQFLRDFEKEWPFDPIFNRHESSFHSSMDFPFDSPAPRNPISSSSHEFPPREENFGRSNRPRSQRIPAAVLPLGQDVRVVHDPRAFRIGSATSASSSSSVSVSSSVSQSRPSYLREYAFLGSTSPSIDHLVERDSLSSIAAPDPLPPKDVIDRNQPAINVNAADINTPDPRFINRNFRLQQRPPQRFSPAVPPSLPSSSSSFPPNHDHHHLLEVDSPPATNHHERQASTSPPSVEVNQYLSNARRYSNSRNPDSVDRDQTRREQSHDRRLLQKQQEEARLREEWSRIEEKRLEEERIMADKNEAERRRIEAEENERRDGLLRNHERALEAAQKAKEEATRIREGEPRVRVQNGRRPLPHGGQAQPLDHASDFVLEKSRNRHFESGRTHSREPPVVEQPVPHQHQPDPSQPVHEIHEEEHHDRHPTTHMASPSFKVTTRKQTPSTTTSTTTTTTEAPQVSTSSSSSRLPRPAGRPGGRRFIGRHKITNPNDRPPLYKPTPPSTTTTKKVNDEEYEDEYEEYEDTTTTTQKPKRKRKRTTTPPSTTTTTLSPGYRERSDGRVIDFKADPNFPFELKGVDLTDYPFYVKIPDNVTFDCKGRHDGYYASVDLHCQIYHHCAVGNRYDFLCPNYTLFDQTTFTCRFINTVNCGQSAKHFNRNFDLYVESTTPDPHESRRVNENSRNNSGRRKKKNNNNANNNNSPSRDSSNSRSSSDSKPRNFFNNRRNSDDQSHNGRTDANSNQNNDNKQNNNNNNENNGSSNESSSRSNGRDDKNGNNNNNHDNFNDDGDETGPPGDEEEESK